MNTCKASKGATTTWIRLRPKLSTDELDEKESKGEKKRGKNDRKENESDEFLLR